jgi:hypothetical protein
MTVTRRFWAALIAISAFAVIVVGAALATSGYFHDGGADANAVFCATGGSCDTTQRNDSAYWLTGYSGWVGLYRPGVGYEALQDNTSGSGSNSTYSTVQALCGNDSSVEYTLVCYTSNL